MTPRRSVSDAISLYPCSGEGQLHLHARNYFGRREGA
jgi:hypothetical protein